MNQPNKNKIKGLKKVRLYLIYLCKLPFIELAYTARTLWDIIVNIIIGTKDVKRTYSDFVRPRNLVYTFSILLSISLFYSAIRLGTIYTNMNKALLILLVISVLYKEWVAGKYLELYYRKM